MVKSGSSIGMPVALHEGDEDDLLHPPRFLLQPFLLLLLTEAPGHGYDLIERMRALGFERVDRSVYRILERLNDAGMVDSDWDTPDSGPARRVFSVTPEGTTELGRWMARLEELDTLLRHCLGRYEAASGRRRRPAAGRRR